jgi:hypothetical protein
MKLRVITITSINIFETWILYIYIYIVVANPCDAHEK